jgi:hypothetical protein
MHLPDLPGLQVLKRLREGGAAGAARYWTKPIDFGQFLAGMRELLPSLRVSEGGSGS